MVQASEWNVYKGLWLLNAIFVFFLIMVMWLNPIHTAQAEAYGFFFVGFFGLVIVDLLILDSLPLGNVIKTITANAPNDKGESRHPMQWFFPIGLVMLFSVVLGLVWGGLYAYEITFNQKIFISVPNLFSTQPFTQLISAQLFDIIETGWMVATVEESIWSGLLFPVIWGVIFLGIIRVLPEQRLALVASLIIAALLTGFLVANVFHAFVYQGNLYAYADAQQHFTISALVTGFTGTTAASIISHAIHNGVAKAQFVGGTYSVLPLEAFIATGGGRDVNRTFPT